MFKTSQLLRKAKILFFLGKGLTRVPRDKSSSISDLFPLRTGLDWRTYFELLDVNSLTRGASVGTKNPVLLVFHDSDGNFLGEESLIVGKKARTTIDMSLYLTKFKGAASFSVFHKGLEGEEFGASFLAERGYTGYEYKGFGVRGYVHGNLDSMALNSSSQLQPLGKRSFFKRRYLVQHVMTGPAEYEFALTNPTRWAVQVRFELKENRKWKTVEKVKINSKGIYLFKTSISDSETGLIRVVSKLAMGRPVVFRLTKDSMDVFHG